MPSLQDLEPGGGADLEVSREPNHVTVKEGVIMDIGGEEESRSVRDRLEELGDPKICKLAHVCLGSTRELAQAGRALWTSRCGAARSRASVSMVPSAKGTGLGG